MTGGLEPCASPQTYAQLAEGEHVFVVVPKAADGRSGRSAESRWTHRHDAADHDDRLHAVESSDLTVTFSADEAQATFKCRLDDEAPATCTSPYVRMNLGGGFHVVGVRATDEAGNEGPEATMRVEIGPD